MKHPVILLMIYPIHSHGVAVDPCDQLCRLDSTRCTAGSYMKNGVCHGYIYSGPRSSGEFCYHTTATSSSCPDSFEPVYVIDAPLLISQRINQSAREATVSTEIFPAPNIRGARSSAPRTVQPTRAIVSTVHDLTLTASTVSEHENPVAPDPTSPPSITTTRFSENGPGTISTSSEASFYHSSETSAAHFRGGSTSSTIQTAIVPQSDLANDYSSIEPPSSMRLTFTRELSSRNVISAFRSSPSTEDISTTSSPSLSTASRTSSPSSSTTSFSITSSPSSSSTTFFSPTSSPFPSTESFFTTSSPSSSPESFSTTTFTASNDASQETLTLSPTGSTESTAIDLTQPTGESPKKDDEIITLPNDAVESSSPNPYRYEIADLNLEGVSRDELNAVSDSVVLQTPRPSPFGMDSNRIPVERLFENEFSPRSTVSSLTGGESSFDENSDDDDLRFEEIYSQESSENDDSSFDLGGFNGENFRRGFDFRFHEISRKSEPSPVRADLEYLSWEDIYSESESDNGGGYIAEGPSSNELRLDMIFPEQTGAEDDISICDNHMRNADRDTGLKENVKVAVEMPPLYLLYTRTKGDGKKVRTTQFNNEENHVGILSEESAQLPSSSSQKDVRFEEIYSDVDPFSVEDVRLLESLREDVDLDFKMEEIYGELDGDGDYGSDSLTDEMP